MKIYVTTDERCIDSYISGEQFGEWSETLNCRVTGVYLQKPDGFGWGDETFEIHDDISEGDTVHVLSMTYSWGDSFGRGSGKLEVLWVFADYSEAVAAARAVEKAKDQFSVEFETSRGLITLSNPGAGYFESVEDISIDDFVVRSEAYKYGG